MDYITLTEMFVIITAFIAFADLLLKFLTITTEHKKEKPPSDQTVGGYS